MCSQQCQQFSCCSNMCVSCERCTCVTCGLCHAGARCTAAGDSSVRPRLSCQQRCYSSAATATDVARQARARDAPGRRRWKPQLVAGHSCRGDKSSGYNRCFRNLPCPSVSGRRACAVAQANRAVYTARQRRTTRGAPSFFALPETFC